jgi:molybdopterin synthase sulfur carrier subunit
MAHLVFFGPAREAAGTRNVDIEGSTIASILQEAVNRYGDSFQEVLSVSQIWMNGEPAENGVPVGIHDEIAVLPPISGG